MGKQRFFTKTIYLDQVFSRRIQDGNHWIGSTVKAFRVLETNNENFKLNLVVDPDNGSVQGIPLGDVRTHNYSTIANRAVLENDIPQADVWVTILFSVEDNLIYTGEKSTGGSEALIVGGSTFNNGKVEVTTAGGLILNADDNRASSEIFNQTDHAIFVGETTKISASDFEETCIKIRSGESFKWDIPDALFSRVSASSATSVYPVILNKAKS